MLIGLRGYVINTFYLPVGVVDVPYTRTIVQSHFGMGALIYDINYLISFALLHRLLEIEVELV